MNAHLVRARRRVRREAVTPDAAHRGALPDRLFAIMMATWSMGFRKLPDHLAPLESLARPPIVE